MWESRVPRGRHGERLVVPLTVEAKQRQQDVCRRQISNTAGDPSSGRRAAEGTEVDASNTGSPEVAENRQGAAAFCKTWVGDDRARGGREEEPGLGEHGCRRSPGKLQWRTEDELPEEDRLLSEGAGGWGGGTEEGGSKIKASSSPFQT